MILQNLNGNKKEVNLEDLSKHQQEMVNKLQSKNKDQQVVGLIESTVCGFRMMAYIIKGKKSKPTIAKSGYYTAYAENLDDDVLSEYGEVYLRVTGTKIIREG